MDLGEQVGVSGVLLVVLQEQVACLFLEHRFKDRVDWQAPSGQQPCVIFSGCCPVSLERVDTDLTHWCPCQDGRAWSGSSAWKER